MFEKKTTQHRDKIPDLMQSRASSTVVHLILAYMQMFMSLTTRGTSRLVARR